MLYLFLRKKQLNYVSANEKTRNNPRNDFNFINFPQKNIILNTPEYFQNEIPDKSC